MTDLPPPDVAVTPATDRDSSAPSGSVDVVVSRDGKGKSYRTVGGSASEVVKDAIEKILHDPYSREWVKSKMSDGEGESIVICDVLLPAKSPAPEAPKKAPFPDRALRDGPGEAPQIPHEAEQ